MNRPTTASQQVVLWALVLGLWLLLVTAFAGQLMFTANLSTLEAFRISLRDWFPWAFLAPTVAWLAIRFPFERGRLALSIPIHLVACMMAILVCEWVVRPLPPVNAPFPVDSQPRFPPDREPNPPFGPAPGQGFENPRPQENRAPVFEPRRDRVAGGLMFRAKFNLPIYWIIVSLVHTLAYQRRSQEREHRALELEARLADAKLQALRMQLHPHFLFNTLNTIATLVHKDPRAADEMITDLGELLRATLDTSAQEIPLRQELDFLARYLDIQQVRFGERLRVEKEIDAAALDALVPTLILQPLVENAIRHGIEPNPAAGVVSLCVQRDGGRVRLAVRDTGGGPKAHAKSQPGIGLSNTRARLNELYGSRARMTLNTDSTGRFSVELEIPFHERTELAQVNAENATTNRS